MNGELSLEKYESILIKNGILLTMQGEGVGSIIDGAIAIEGENIIAVGKTADVTKEYGSAELVIDAKGKAVLPGFVDGHIHTGLSLVRGEAQDVPEIEWMLKTMAPFTKYFTPEHSIKGSRVGVLEALKAGTTTFGEIGGNMTPVAEQVFVPSGVRANLADTINQIGPESRPDPSKPYIFFEDIGEAKFKSGVELVERFNGKGDGTGFPTTRGAVSVEESIEAPAHAVVLQLASNRGLEAQESGDAGSGPLAQGVERHPRERKVANEDAERLTRGDAGVGMGPWQEAIEQGLDLQALEHMIDERQSPDLLGVEIEGSGACHGLPSC